ncbi:MAG: hypothetical protein KF682_08595, partial [Nitrospira sp.]|nr:hypothetical protein [Nitrospira sp.]
MPTLLVIILLLIASWSLGCANRSSYNVHQPPVAQAERYIQTEGLSQLPNRRLAITSFGIEYDTKLLFPLGNDRGYQLPGEIYTVSDFHKEIVLDLTRDHMQVLADQAYTQLVEDLQTAGYDIIPYEAYKDLASYRSLVELAGHESPVSITFKRGDPKNPVQGEALVFAPTELGWYSPAFGEIGSRLGEMLAS